VPEVAAAVLSTGAAELDRWRISKQRRLLRPWRWREVPERAATFRTPAGAVTTRHFGLEPPEDAPRTRRFDPC
jgi:hypothetical protein